MADRLENDLQVAKGNYRKEDVLLQERGKDIAAKRELVNMKGLRGSHLSNDPTKTRLWSDLPQQKYFL